MGRTHQGLIRFGDRHRAWEAMPADIRRLVVERLRELWLVAFRQQLQVMRDDERQDHS
jgi:predicted Fe-S protein YdhL (DUF1289 family)